MRPTLRVEVARFLEGHGPSTSTVIARGVHARRRDVDEVLASDGFERVPPPSGLSSRAIYYGLSRLVPGPVRGVSRAAVILGILRDGEPHKRSELLAALVTAGVSIYVNNGAAELRAAGYDVRFSRRGGGSYWIESFPPDEALSEQDTDGAPLPPFSAHRAGTRPEPQSCSLNAAEGVAA